MDSALTKGLEPIENMLKSLNVNAVFGQPVQEGGVTIIPVAQVGYTFGAGVGYGRSAEEAPGGSGAGEEAGSGAGSGGGGMGRARPVGFIRIAPDGVTYEPIMDPQRISLFGIAMVMWNIFWITATVRAFASRRA
jgi:uncharacterized spore protein YtfJ